ncbi:NAD(P)-dependent oxidoreductase [Microbacterium sp. PRC9]|uniref:NAD-dependent epimerase/dehydratase family protein n=1 Tax=Microbacterium sp. PRC9 TaxID=2962591 RepID=UPI002882D26D|nr:NAD(P)-dependent oxidoreductase [Microbacterium sp. PRC9]MDT0144831.1 NAD(P)-dependent oxidoreductase [Microbacterium sp. PRC9]
MRILVTGAAGRAATGLRPVLIDHGHELVLQDLVAPVAPVGRLERLVLGDLNDERVLEEAFAKGLDAVVHMGGHSGERPWSDLVDANLLGTQRILSASHDHGVQRVLLASSTHIAGFWPTAVARRPGLPPRPDSLYGVSKVAVEALGSVYADRFGMLVVAARIGTVEAEPTNVRALSTWLSFPDLGRLVEAVLRTDAVGFHPVWAVSANSRGWFPLEPGHRIGYRPVDDAETYAAEIDLEATPDTLIGGAFTDLGRPLGGVW